MYTTIALAFALAALLLAAFWLALQLGLTKVKLELQEDRNGHLGNLLADGNIRLAEESARTEDFRKIADEAILVAKDRMKLVDDFKGQLETATAVARTCVDIIRTRDETIEGLQCEEVGREYTRFSRRTIIRSSYLQLISNPATFMLATPVIAGLETILRTHDEEWFDKVIEAFTAEHDGNREEITKIMKECAREFNMLRPPSKGELFN